jgi:ZIP family zinc transporter
MSRGLIVVLGAIAGFSIFIGLPIARMRGLTRGAQGFLNAAATGILLFLLWDILSHAADPLRTALRAGHQGQWGSFAGLTALFVGGLSAGLLALVAVNHRLYGKARVAGAPAPPRSLALMIATGLGLHNLSEGLAIGQSAAAGAIAFAGVLVIGFALHNITEGFGIAAPLALDVTAPSWGFLFAAGLLGGGPTLVGTVIGSVATSSALSVLFLALAAGALLYVINEMFGVGRRLNAPLAMSAGLLLGFFLAFGTDLLLSYLNA